MKIKIIFPFPVSNNSLYDNRNGGRAKSFNYREWIGLTEATIEVFDLSQGHGKEEQLRWEGRPLFSVDRNTLVKTYLYPLAKWFTVHNYPKKIDLKNLDKAIDDYLPKIIKGFDDCAIFESHSAKPKCNYFGKAILIIEEVKQKSIGHFLSKI